MKISKRSLRTLPVLLLLEMLSPVLLSLAILLAYFVTRSGSAAAALISALLPSLLITAVWIVCTVVIYGIMELSHFFAYSWYLHLIYFVIKAVSLVIEGLGAANAGVIGIVPDVLSSAQQFIGILSHAMILLGFRSVMKKTEQEKLSKRCRAVATVYLTLGSLSLLFDGASYILKWIDPGAVSSQSVIYTVIIAVSIAVVVITAVISIPAFIAVRRSCMKVYHLLFNAKEV